MQISDEDLIAELKRRFGEQRKMLESLNDLTQKLTTVNEKLLESEQLKTDFLSNIRNEINNPLTAILGICETILMEKTMDLDTLQEMIKMVHMEAFNLDFQLRTIFAAAEIEAGEARLHIVKVQIEEMIHRIVDSFENLAESNALQFDMDIQLKNKDGEPVDFLTDAEKIHLVISNLISNAIEYGSDGDRINLKAWIENEVLYVTVQDFGIGIDHRDQKRIFDRFVQLDTGLTKKHKGHGLGLSVTRAAIEMLQGSISVRSEKGQGSIFSISVPGAHEFSEVEIYAPDGNEELF